MSLNKRNPISLAPPDSTAAISFERLVALFFAHQGNVVDKWEQYLSIYASEFARFLSQAQPVRLLEIGVQNGGSLELWAKYLPNGSEIVGLDIDPAVEKLHFDSPIKVVVSDVKDTERRDSLLGDEPFDIVIDDGSHRSDDIIQAFRSLFDKLRPGGVYIVEDLHASYWESMGGGFRRSGSAIEFFKNIVDSLGIDHFDANAKTSPLELDELQKFGRWIDRVVFYDSVVVVQKRLSEKIKPYRRMLSGGASEVVDPVDGLLKAPPAMVRELMLGAATSHVLNGELLARLISELQLQGELKASVEGLRAQLKAQTTEHDLKLELRRKEADEMRRVAEERERERNDLLSEKEALTNLIATERKTLEAAIDRLSFEQELEHRQKDADETRREADERERERDDLPSEKDALTSLIASEQKTLEAAIDRLSSERQSLLLALGHANSERDALLQSASWRLTSPLRAGYRLIRASERLIRHRIKMSRPSRKVLKALPPQSSMVIDPEQLIGRSDLFDSKWYLTQLGEATIRIGNSVRHYLTHGAAEGLYPNPLFDTRWYTEQYADVRDSGVNPLFHYLEYGAAEGRDPNPFFDSDWYLEQNPDVRKAGFNPLRHYLLYGAKEGREPSDRFHSHWYRKKYLRDASPETNALAHYLQHGRAAGHECRSPDSAYLLEVLKQDQALATTISEIEQHIDVMTIRPRFFVLIRGTDPVLKEETERSLQDQVYLDWLVLESPIVAIEEPAESETSPWFFIELEGGDRVHKSALYAFASAINADPTVDLVYADDDRLDDSGARVRPFFKPDWSPDYLESMNYIGPSACFRWSLAQPFLEQGSSGYDLMLRLTEVAKNISHVRQTLFHRRHDELLGSFEDISHDVEALGGRLRRTNRAGEIEPVIPDRRCYDCKITLSSNPLISVIIPTAGKSVDLGGRTIDLLINCLDTITSRSTYKQLEFIVVDNGDLTLTQRTCLRNYGAKSVTFRKPKFNVAEKLNLGASIATGELFLLLNDDVEPLSSDWIERLVEHFEKPGVGVVGAKLLYRDQTIQHVGVVLNSCNPDHVRRHRPRDDLGYYFSTAAARNFSAVTGACMMTRASNYRSLGGYSVSLAISFNDVDFCLRTIERGLTVVYAPRAELIHYESQSRVPELDMDELQFFYKRWFNCVSDRFYNESDLAVAPPTFEVKHNSRAF